MKQALQADQRTRTYHIYGEQQAGFSSARQTVIHSLFNAPSNFRAIAGSLAGEAPAIALNNASKLEFAKSVHTWFLRNNANVPVCVTQYELVTRQDTTNAAGSPTEFISNPSAAFDQGLINLGMAANFSTQVGVTPHESADFVKLFKITGVKTYVLPVGGTKIIRRKVKNYSTMYSKSLDIDAACLRGETRGFMWCAHGHAARITASTETTSGGNLGYIHHSKYVLRNSQDYISDLQKSFTLTSLSTTAANVIDYGLNASTVVAVV